jgi:ferredoxin-NADP reductase
MKFEAKITEVIPRTFESSSFRFPKPAGLVYKPGQYMLCTINVGGKQLMHAFSISSSPTEDYLEFTKKFTSNEYSVALRGFKGGETVAIDAPYGSFTFEGEHPKIALLTGGIGITPFRSIIKYAADKHLSSSITLLYGCHSSADIAFKTEFDQLTAQNPNFKAIYIVSSPDADWKGPVGHITEEFVKREMPDFKERKFFACGPPGMVTAMKSMIQSLNLPDSALKLESFAGYT